jgi:hypothetical protein
VLVKLSSDLPKCQSCLIPVMSNISIERIQICCSSALEAAEVYSIVFGLMPCWAGNYQLTEAGGVPIEQGKSVWFALDNTTIELFDTSARDSNQGLSSIVIENGEEPLSDSVYGSLSERQTVYVSDSGADQHQTSFQSAIDDDNHYRYSLINRSTLVTSVVTSADSVASIAAAQRQINGVDHIVLYASNFERVDARFGAKGIGIRLALDQHVATWGGRMLFYRPSGLTLEVIIADSNDNRPKRANKADFFWGIAYSVDNLESVHKRLSELGVALSDVREGRKPGTQVCTLKSHSIGVPTLLVGST